MMKLFYKRQKSPDEKTREQAEKKRKAKIIMPDALLQLIDYIVQSHSNATYQLVQMAAHYDSITVNKKEVLSLRVQVRIQTTRAQCLVVAETPVLFLTDFFAILCLLHV